MRWCRSWWIVGTAFVAACTSHDPPAEDASPRPDAKETQADVVPRDPPPRSTTAPQPRREHPGHRHGREDRPKHHWDCLTEPNDCKDGVPAGPPEKLTATEIKAVLRPLATAAHDCGARHGLTHRDRIPVRFVVEGETGTVTRAKAEGPFMDTDVAACVEGVAIQATFPRFTRETQGFQYKFKMGSAAGNRHQTP